MQTLQFGCQSEGRGRQFTNVRKFEAAVMHRRYFKPNFKPKQENSIAFCNMTDTPILLNTIKFQLLNK